MMCTCIAKCVVSNLLTQHNNACDNIGVNGSVPNYLSLCCKYMHELESTPTLCTSIDYTSDLRRGFQWYKSEEDWRKKEREEDRQEKKRERRFMTETWGKWCVALMKNA